MRHRLPSVHPIQVGFRVPLESDLVHAAVFVSWPQGTRAPLLELRVRADELAARGAGVPVSARTVLLHVARRALRLPLRFGADAWRQRGEWLCCPLAEVDVELLLHALRRPRPKRAGTSAPPAAA